MRSRHGPSSRLLQMLGLLFGFMAASTEPAHAIDPYAFAADERVVVERFSVDRLPGLVPDLSNPHADALNAARLGHRLFFDRRLSRNGQVSCAHCHQPDRAFTDGRRLARGLAVLRRNTPSVIGAAYSPWLYWDGRKDSLWAQALEPIESASEHGLGRVEFARRVLAHYREEYEAAFGPAGSVASGARFPENATPRGDRVARQAWTAMRPSDRKLVNAIFTNAGKAIMAYERRLVHSPARFDRFVAALSSRSSRRRLRGIYSVDEVIGLRLFMGRGNCASCHNGPLFTNFEFHNVGAPEPRRDAVDLGRSEGVLRVKVDEFNCLSAYSAAPQEHCQELLFLKTDGMELIGAFKTPSLRNVAETAPYMQSGQLATLREVVEHYNRPTPPFFDPQQHTARPHFDIMPLGLTDVEVSQLVAFLKTLTSETRSPWMRSPVD